MKIGILISGRGSNMVALVDAVKSGEIPHSEVAVVISDKPDAAGLAKAQDRGVETVVIERRGLKREEHDAEIVCELKKLGVELVCLAGYMRLLSPHFIRAFPNRIINIHPSLLPAYPGLNVHERVLAAGEMVSGCTVHYVNEDLDAGEVILQREVPVLAGDTVTTLSARILDEEHVLYVKAVRRLAQPLVRPTPKTFDSLHILDGCLQWLVKGFVGGVVFGILGSSAIWWMEAHSYSFYDLAKSDNLLGKIWLLLHFPLYMFMVITGLRPSEASFAGYLLIFFYWFFVGTAICAFVQGVGHLYKRRRP